MSIPNATRMPPPRTPIHPAVVHSGFHSGCGKPEYGTHRVAGEPSAFPLKSRIRAPTNDSARLPQ